MCPAIAHVQEVTRAREEKRRVVELAGQRFMLPRERASVPVHELLHRVEVHEVRVLVACCTQPSLRACRQLELLPLIAISRDCVPPLYS